MSRSTVAKSRQDKANKTASAPTPAVAHEIVPGKFNDHDWNCMLDQDDGDDFVYNIVEEICGSAMDTIFKNYIEKQLVPYTVLQAKDAILQIIEWQFLSRDEGEQNVENDSGWAQDEEPAPAETDCWAQGSVPKTIVAPSIPEPIVEEDAEALQAEASEEEAQVEGETEETSPPVLETEPTVIVEEKAGMAIEEKIVEEKQKEESSGSESSAKGRRKKGYRPHKGPLRSAGLSRMTESLDETEMRLLIDHHQAVQAAMVASQGSPDPITMQMPNSCHSILKLQAGRPPGNRDVIYDDHGNVISVTKLDPEKLPSHSVKTKFHVLEPGHEGKKSGVRMRFQVVDPAVEAAQARLEAMRTGKYIKSKAGGGQAKKLAPRPPESPRSVSQRSSSLRPAGHGREGITPLPPPLIEAMEVSPGVVVKEGDRVKKGPRQRPRQSELIATAAKRGLKTIHIRSGEPTISVSQILYPPQPPTVRPLADTPPIPPIAPQQQPSAGVC